MRWINWVQLMLGVWILISPWVLGYSAIATALWSSIIAGVFVAILAFWELMMVEEDKKTNNEK